METLDIPLIPSGNLFRNHQLEIHLNEMIFSSNFMTLTLGMVHYDTFIFSFPNDSDIT